MDYSYESFINKETLYTENIGMDMRLSMGLDEQEYIDSLSKE